MPEMSVMFGSRFQRIPIALLSRIEEIQSDTQEMMDNPNRYSEESQPVQRAGHLGFLALVTLWRAGFKAAASAHQKTQDVSPDETQRKWPRRLHKAKRNALGLGQKTSRFLQLGESVRLTLDPNADEAYFDVRTSSPIGIMEILDKRIKNVLRRVGGMTEAQIRQIYTYGHGSEKPGDTGETV